MLSFKNFAAPWEMMQSLSWFQRAFQLIPTFVFKRRSSNGAAEGPFLQISGRPLLRDLPNCEAGFGGYCKLWSNRTRRPNLPKAL